MREVILLNKPCVYLMICTHESRMWWEKFQPLAISGFFFLSKQTLTAWSAFCLPTVYSTESRLGLAQNWAGLRTGHFDKWLHVSQR